MRMTTRKATMKTLRKSLLTKMRSKMPTTSNKETKRTRMRMTRMMKKATTKSKPTMMIFHRMEMEKQSKKTVTTRKRMSPKMAMMSNSDNA